MAGIPDHFSIDTLEGLLSLNKAISDDPDKFLILQNLPADKREEIRQNPIKLRFWQSVDDDGISHITTGPVLGDRELTPEERILDQKRRDLHSPVHGHLKTTSWWTPAGDPSLPSGGDGGSSSSSEEDESDNSPTASAPLPAATSHPPWDCDRVVHAYTEGPGWTMEQAWGLQRVGGVRRYVRHLRCRGGPRRLSDGDGDGAACAEGRLVYDWVSPLGEGEAAAAAATND